MAVRHPFGGGIADYVFETNSGVVSVAPGATITFYTAQTGGTQITDLTSDSAGTTPLGSVVSQDGSTSGYNPGDIAVFYGPVGVRAMWASADGGPRKLMVSNDIAAELDAVGVGVPNTKVVAASGSTAAADYVCDGVADQVQIQAAINDVKAAGGGTVRLTAGTFNISASVVLNGDGDPDTSVMVTLQGVGNYGTRLLGASGIHVITVSQIARVHLCDFGIQPTGAGDGIRSTAVDDDTYWRSFDESVFERLYITGGYFGHTGWAMNLGSAFRSSVRDIHIEGVKGGIRLAAEHAEQNPGDCTFDRMMVGVSETNGVAYQIESPTSSMNQNLFTTCHSFADPSKAGTIAWNLTGAHGNNHIKLINCNSEQFATLVSQQAGFDCDMRFDHVTARNGSTVISAQSSTFYNRYEIGELYVEPSATVTVINDAGPAVAAMPNRYQIAGYADTGSTLNATIGGGVLEAGLWHGPGTIASSLKGSLAGITSRAVTLTDGATITIDAARGSYHRVTLAGNRTMAAPINPGDGQRMIVEVIQDATGSRTLTWNAVFTFGTITNALTTTPAKRDIFEFVYNAAAVKWYVVNASKNL